MDYLSQALKNIDDNREDLIKSLQKLISFKSVAIDTEGEAPFGEEVDRAYRYMLSFAENEGFETVDADGYGGHIEFRGKGNETVGIAGHIDVVPEGKEWDYDPFGGTIEDGRIYGRGAVDDKGPVIASFYAMKALKDAGYVPEKNIRLILGLDEETNWKGMYYYLDKCGQPDTGFTPDGGFPVIHGEKGIIVFDIVGKLSKNTNEGLRLTSLKGGHAHNMVADYARAVVFSQDKDEYNWIREIADNMRKEKGYRISVRQAGKSLEIVTEGKSAHGARPYLGQNAIPILMELLGKLNFANDDYNDFISFFNEHIGYEINGESLGVGLEDEVSGKLTLNVGTINLEKDSITVNVDIRYPVTAKAGQVYSGMEDVLNKYNLGIIKIAHNRPIYKPADDPLITTLMDIYRKYFERDDEPLVIGGGTYARAVNNIVAFGPGLPGSREVGHQKNEFIEIDELMTMAKAYTEAIYELSKGDE